jgi:3-phenylpropionate/trans-cinnamate dioxygenase ferredoxin component
VGKVALRNVLSKLASDASKAPPPVESVGRVSVARAGGQLYAFGDLCTCAGAGSSCPLSGGLLTVTTIMCQCHGSELDITTRAVIRGPRGAHYRVYETQVTGGHVGIRA